VATVTAERQGTEDAHKVKDPVCGMRIDPHAAEHRREHRGRTYYFCGAGCAEKFAADPEAYLEGEAKAEAPEDAVYTCPMHPEIEQVGPGDCPICGMALEPKSVSLEADEGPSAEYVDMRRRFWISALLSLPLLVGVMGHHLFGLAIEPPQWLQLVLATPVVLWAAWPFFKRFWVSVQKTSPNMWTLIGLGVGTAYVYSLIATLAPGIFPDAFRGPAVRSTSISRRRR